MVYVVLVLRVAEVPWQVGLGGAALAGLAGLVGLVDISVVVVTLALCQLLRRLFELLSVRLVHHREGTAGAAKNYDNHIASRLLKRLFFRGCCRKGRYSRIS